MNPCESGQRAPVKVVTQLGSGGCAPWSCVLSICVLWSCTSPSPGSASIGEDPAVTGEVAPPSTSWVGEPSLAGSPRAGSSSVEAPSSTTRWVRALPAAHSGLLEAPGRVLGPPESTAAVSAPLRARVLRVRVRAGQRVVEGQALVDVMMPELMQAAGALSAALIRQEAYATRKAQLETLRAEGLVRAAELAEVSAQLADGRADGQAARATLRAAGVSDKRAEALLLGEGALTLRSPLDGVVVSVDAVPGETREAVGGSLVEVVGEGEGQVEARWSGELSRDAGFDFMAADGRVTPVKLISMAPRLEGSDGARLAWFQADGAALAVGSTGRLRLRAEAQWTAVPARAVSSAPGSGVHVYVRGEDGVRTVPVRVIARSGAQAVVDGLTMGDEVASDAAEVAR